MPHRPGHIDNPGSGTYSMDRRNYLKTFAIGTVAAGLLLDSCTKPTPPEENHHDGEGTQGGATPGGVSWGYISLYEPDVVTITQAKQLGSPAPTEARIRIPFFNSNGIELKEKDVIGFHLMKIGNPTRFVIAINLSVTDHDPADDPAAMTKRNTEMDTLLCQLGYKKEPVPPAPDPTQPCK